MNISKFTSALQKSGYARSSHFECQITGPGNSISENDLLYRIDEIEIPGRSLSTIEHKFTNIGPPSKIAYDSIYGDFTINILLSEDMREKEYFEEWHNAAVDTGAFEVSTSKYSRSPFAVKYIDNYVGTITIRQFGPQGSLYSIHTLLEAFPTAIGGIQMGWENSEPAKLSVTFSFRSYRTVFNKQDQPGLGLGFSLRLDRDGLAGSFRDPNLGNIVGATELGHLSATIGNATNRFASIRNF